MPIALSSWIDRTSLRPGRPGNVAVALELAATGTPVEGQRAAARTVLALDVSLSMKGEPLDQVVRSVDRLLDALGEEDEIGVVAFAANATRVVDPIKVDAAGKRLVRSRVGRLFVESSTNIEAGLDLAAAMANGGTTPPGMRRGVVLLSDGAPNVGAHTSDLLREVVRRHRPDVSFFSLGYGDDHAEEILAAIGDAGGGGYEFVPDPAVCARAFARAIGAQGDVVASGIELSIALGEGVELVRFVGREETRIGRGGITVSLADMVHGARRLVVAELAIDPPTPDRFAQTLLQATARWRGPSDGVASAAADAMIEIADREPEVRADGARQVLLARADEVRDAARRLADRGQFTGAAAGIRKLMAEIDRLPGWVPADGTPLAEAYELLVDEAMAFERRPSAEVYAAFKKATVGSRLAAPVPSQARSRGDASQKLIEHVAGDCPEAWLVRLGPNARRYRLQEEAVIGRTSEAEIQVASSMVSRRHAEVFANAGDYWVCDMGSTNTTMVNGQPLGRAPHKLTTGDVVRVGDVDLRYEEAPKPVT